MGKFNFVISKSNKLTLYTANRTIIKGDAYYVIIWIEDDGSLNSTYYTNEEVSQFLKTGQWIMITD